MKKLDLLMDATALDRALSRISHQILEKNPDLGTLGIVGVRTRGAPLAKRIAAKLNDMEKTSLVPGTLDITLYRDDYRKTLKQPQVQVTDIQFDINDKNIVLVDDVLYTGRTARAALDALMDFGRPRTIQLAVLIDRGLRELPIRADFVGRKISTQKEQEVSLRLKETDGEDGVWLVKLEEGD
ncbi:MAG: bifunctional pyr operon transcriptional regulator/uracil phosphoribosyltransferase PyrR [Chitinivibrionales bacterium]|nr:bifunctional pyr operon transcriptional regulator/uracil phosphoribosyltransferase PyrR [Chitinivibrionales bacterium]MBD3394668.1 bifunctional pyr operon transcriptional regulator/uracil phosphoribosyltransferase PyrR [Chitinivibrionales bacterium]